MFRQLWKQLALLLIITSILTLGLMVWMNHMLLGRDFARFQRQSELARANQVREVLLALYGQDGDFHNLQQQVPYFCMMLGVCVKVTDASGGSMASYCLPGMGTSGSPPQGGADVVLPLDLEGRTLGKVEVMTHGKGDVWTSQNELLRKTLSLSILVTAALAVLVMVGGSLLLSPWLVRPVKELTLAAEAVGRGDLDRRVTQWNSDELGRLAQAFNRMSDWIRGQEGLRKKLVSDVAHELRTPLANLSATMEALQDRMATPSPQLYRSLGQEVARLTTLVDDLQELAQVDGGLLKMRRDQVEAAGLARRVAEKLQPLAARDRVELVVKDQAGGARLEGDAELLERALSNLVDNALTYAGPGGKVTVTCRRVGDFLELEVADTGPGIPEEHLEHIFQRFYRADPSRSRKTGGTGLGLAIVKEVVEAHAGKVDARNLPRAGAAFRIQLPLSAGGSEIGPA